MPLPKILTGHALPLPTGGLAPVVTPRSIAASPLGGTLPTTATLGLSMQQQLQANWCWAAVSSSISHYYNSDSAWTQCSIANSELSQSSCCDDGASASCNQPWYLDQALTCVGHFSSVSSAVEMYNDVQVLVANKEPLGVRIGWLGGGGHFVAISGYTSIGGTQFVDVEDPIYGSSTVTYQGFCTSYQGNGTWTHSYRTQR